MNNDKDFSKGCGENILTKPITQEQIDNLKPCRITNPMVGNAHGTKIPDWFDEEKSAYEVLKVRNEVRKGKFPYWFMEKYYPFREEFGTFPKDIPAPLVGEGLSFTNPAKLTDVVHMDFPTDMPKAVHRWLLREGYNVKNWNPNWVNFLESVVDVEFEISKAIKERMWEMFRIKCWHLQERPEEILTKYKVNQIVTAYKEGSPTHGSTGQGHMAAAAAGTGAIIRSFNIPFHVIKTIADTKYSWGQFRGLAGVHYGIDGIMSLVVNPDWQPFLKDSVLRDYLTPEAYAALPPQKSIDDLIQYIPERYNKTNVNEKEEEE